MTPSKSGKILYLLHSYFNKAGTEQHTKHLMKGLSEEFETACLAPQKNEFHFIQDDKVLRTYQHKELPWPVTPLNSEHAERVFKETIEQYDPDIIHVQHIFNWPLSILEKVIETKRPCLISFHDYYMMTPYFTGEGSSVQAVNSNELSIKYFQADITAYLKKRREYIDRQLKYFKLLISPSSALAQDLEKFYRYQYKIIAHGIPLAERLPKVEKPGTLRFGYVGSLLPQKGWKQLVEAFRTILPQHKNIELHIFGSSEQVQPQEKQSETRIFFHGSYETETLPKICASIDVAIIPSVFPETFSLVLSELWQLGIPVAVSRIGALEERVKDGINGKTFEPGSISEIEKTLLWFIENESWKSWKPPPVVKLDEMINEYSAVYRSIL